MILKALPADFTNQQLLKLVEDPWDYQVEKFSLPEEFRLLFANFGEAMITTQAVGSVSDFKQKDPNTYHKLVQEINNANVQAIDALKKIKKGDRSALPQFRDSFDKGRLLTKKLGELSNVGVEPNDCTELIEESKQNGAFVSKLPGAGGKDAIAALALDDDSLAKLRKLWSTRSELTLLDIKPVDRGLIEISQQSNKLRSRL
jgi:phosphomevalonate kinase